jgi:hypothetical protein
MTMSMPLSKHSGSSRLLWAVAQVAFVSITVVQAQDTAMSASINCFSGNGALSNKTYAEWRDAIVGAASPIYTLPDFETFIDANATGELGAFGHCSRMINGNLLGLAYVCNNDESGDCLCLAQYNGTVCTSCTLCNASAPAELENFEADCSNVNGECKIECGHAVGSATSLDTGADLSPFEDANELCPYPAPAPGTDPTFSPPKAVPPSTSNAAPGGNYMPQQLKASISALVVTTALFWIY